LTNPKSFDKPHLGIQLSLLGPGLLELLNGCLDLLLEATIKKKGRKTVPVDSPLFWVNQPMVKIKNYRLSIGVRLVHGGKHLLDPVRLGSGLLQLLLICLPRTRLWRLSFPIQICKKKGWACVFVG
jgi:hypothetical protein